LAGAASSDPLLQLLDLVAERLASRVAAALAIAAPDDVQQAEPWRLLDVSEAAARLNRSTRWIRERAKRGDLPFVRLDGGALAFELEDVQAFARARRISADEAPPLANRLQTTRKPASPASSAILDRATDPEVET
jgi:excisionase family DNA binding protein